jgi:hypothetical protein
VDKVGEVTPVIEDEVERLTVREVDGLLDTPDILLVRLPLPGVHRHASRSNSGGRVILKNIIYKILWRVSLKYYLCVEVFYCGVRKTINLSLYCTG